MQLSPILLIENGLQSETSSTKDDKSDLLSDNNLEQDVQQFGQLIESSDAQMTQYSSPPSPLETPPVPTIKRPQKNSNGSTKRFKTDVNKLREEDVDGSASFLTLPTGNVKNETEELSPSKDVTEQLLDSSGQELISQDQGESQLAITKRSCVYFGCRFLCRF